MQTTDAALIDQYREMAGRFKGQTVVRHVDSIAALKASAGGNTILDYGCGNGSAWGLSDFLERLGHPAVALYDPAHPSHDRKPPGRFDGVICCDVLEHIPEQHVAAVIDELFAYGRRWVWASVCCRPAKKRFPDGTNVHVTIRDMAWWLRLFKAADTGVPWELVETP